MELLGIYFSPRIKSLKKATLYSFSTYETRGYKIPHRYIDTDLIKTHWDDILRLMVTINLKPQRHHNGSSISVTILNNIHCTAP
ncbi:MAG: hypothetical protein CK430_00530 [Legionella sp.]|nr:MAG: hypothetical protein CK430_00530 [Legionella sp.]